MAKRIGEILVEKGLITREQLYAGLKSQLMLGGHLGTSLIEMGFISEERLGRELSEILGVPYAPREMFDDIPEWAISCLDARMVERHRAVPIGKQANSLHLAVLSPRDVSSLSSLTGHRIVPWVTTETRLVEAMERYYKIPRTTRYICISKELTRAGGEVRAQASAREEIYPGPWMSLAQSGQRVVATETWPGDEPSSCHAVDLGVGAGGAALDLGDGGRSWRDIAKEYFEDDEPEPVHRPRAPGRRSAASDDVERSGRWSFAETSMLMSHADDRDELHRVVLGYAAGQLSAAILFGVKSEVATPLACRGEGLDEERLEGLEFAVAENSLFDLLLGEEAYCGPVPEGTRYQRFYKSLARDVPREIALVPVYMSDRLVAILYGEAMDGAPLEECMPDLRQLAKKLALSLHMLVLKMKIRAV